jgi:hypothetical protein
VWTLIRQMMLMGNPYDWEVGIRRGDLSFQLLRPAAPDQPAAVGDACVGRRAGADLAADRSDPHAGLSTRLSDLASAARDVRVRRVVGLRDHGADQCGARDDRLLVHAHHGDRQPRVG